ncbi:MAG: glycosyltransferase family 2 protein [Candidatus Portnoybacteria bacterium]|nr:glycosyltransferase family 2 protein [Candidatus Portnoybacteria bacterium]
MKASIVITHHKEPRLLFKLLKSLNSRISSYQFPISNYEIIVVDSEAQKGGGRLIRKKFPEVRYVPFSKNVGYAKIVNAGLRLAKAPYILIVNADIAITPEEIVKMRIFLEETKEAGAVGVSDCFTFPTLATLIARRTFFASTPWGKRTLRHYEMRDYERKEPQVVDWVRGDCWMVKKSALKKVGLMDERFFMYFEDTDWCRRAKAKGLSVFFLPGVHIIQQKPGASRQKSIKGVLHRVSHLISFLRYWHKWNRKAKKSL